MLSMAASFVEMACGEDEFHIIQQCLYYHFKAGIFLHHFRGSGTRTSALLQIKERVQGIILPGRRLFLVSQFFTLDRWKGAHQQKTEFHSFMFIGGVVKMLECSSFLPTSSSSLHYDKMKFFQSILQFLMLKKNIYGL